MLILCLGTRIVTTPGLLRKRNYPNRILCIWNITCSGEDMMYFNMSQHDSQGDIISIHLCASQVYA